MTSSAEARAALALARGAVAALDAGRQHLNDLNVYPVPDGDTGSNLCDTAAALADGLAEGEFDRADRAAVGSAATRAALMGARGNSGIILSQIVRGFAESLAAEPGEIGPAEVSRGLRAASDCAYRAVRQPVEGTMLTAIREMAEESERLAGTTDLDQLLDRLLAAGDASVERTQEMLHVLRDAGVVDAGAAGLVEFVRGAVAGLRGEQVDTMSEAVARPVALESLHQEPSRFRYCTTFLVEGDGVDEQALERALDSLGDCLLVVGERPTLKVHVHTDDPGAALTLAVSSGTIDGVEIADMHRQTADRERRLAAAGPVVTTSIVAVVDGPGNEAAFRASGAALLVSGGASMNPSAGEIAKAIAAAPGSGVLVFPNNNNVILAAEHAATLAERPVRVVPTRSVAAGIALLDTFDPAAQLGPLAERLTALNTSLRHAEVTAAVRAATVDGVQVAPGQYLGLVDGRLACADDDPAVVVAETLERLVEGEPLRVGVVRGTGAESLDLDAAVAELRRRAPGSDIALHEGGQPLYPMIAWAERAELLSASNTAVVLDSTADLEAPHELHHNWRMVPLSVRFGEESLLDFIEIGPDEFYRRLAGSPLPPRTAAPSPGAYQEAFGELDGYARILVLPVSARVSASAQSAELAARTLDPDGHRITVLDGAAVSGATLLLADGLQRLLVRRVTENEAMEWFEQARDRLALLFSVETLEYLRRGGRIGRAQAVIGGLLRVRPLLTLREGEVAAHGKVRGRRAVLPAFERFLCDHVSGDGSGARVALCHARNQDQVEELRAMIARARPLVQIDHVVELGAVVGTHGGPGTLGMAVLPAE